jgi:hypothetical protein
MGAGRESGIAVAVNRGYWNANVGIFPAMRESEGVSGTPGRRYGAFLPYLPLDRPRNELLAVLALVPVLMLAAVANGFPIIFYDTGAYVLQGFENVFIAERSPVYSLFLRYAGGPESLWYVALVQCAVVAFTIVEFARALRPRMSLWVLLLVGLVLTLATGLPWYAAQIEPDCFVAIAPMAIYLLAFHRLGFVRNLLLVLCAVLAAASHSSHLGLAAGLVMALVLLKAASLVWRDLPRPRVLLSTASVVAALALVIGCNYVFTKQIFFSRSGSTFLAARLMQDGLIKPVLDADCPMHAYRLCPYKNDLPTRADAYLWEEPISPFFRLGGFPKMGPESARLVHESLTRYPFTNAFWAVLDTAGQFVAVPTGDGIVPQAWVLTPEFRRTIPKQMDGYNHAYQQRGDLWFLPLNLLHVPVALASMLALWWLLRRAVREGNWRDATLPAFILLALLGNAFICGVFSGPHFRYQSRMMWWPALAVVLIGGSRIPGLNLSGAPSFEARYARTSA